MKRRMCVLAALWGLGCGVDLSLPTVNLRAPMAGAVMSSRNVRLKWDNANPGAAPLCVNVFARRGDEVPVTRLRVAHDATERLVRSDELPAAPTFFWNVSDCVAPAPPARWQVVVPLEPARGEAVAAGVSSDVDGDARPDLFYGSLRASGRRVLADASSPLWRGTVYSLSRTTPSPVSFRPAGDVDGDGYADMIVLDGDLSVIYGGAYDELTDPVPLLRGGARDAQVIGGYDLDGDGRAEIATLSPEGLVIRGVVGRGALRTVVTEAVPFTATVTDARWLSDHDGDGVPELAAIARGEVWIRWSAAEGVVRWTRGGDAARALHRIGDVDGDEREDLAWVSEQGRLVVCVERALDRCEAMGAGVLSATGITLPGATERTPVTLGLTQDGHVEVTLYARDEAGRRAQVIGTLARADLRVSPEVLAVDDDGDGRGDLFVRVSAGAMTRFVARDESSNAPAPEERPTRAPKRVVFMKRPETPVTDTDEDADPGSPYTAKSMTDLGGDPIEKIF